MLSGGRAPSDSADGAGTGRRRATSAAALLVALVALAVYANALSGGFVFDDGDNVLRNPWVREPGRVGEAFRHHMAAFSSKYDTSYYRPLMHVILAGAHRIFGLEPWGFHLVLLLLHAAASVAVFALLVRFAPAPATAGGPAREELRRGGPLVGALLFAVHPVHSEAVAWISGVVDLSCALLALLALLGATSRTAWSRLLLAPLAFFLALLAKEPAVMLLAVLAALFAARGDLGDSARRRRLVASGGAMAAALLAYLALRVTALGGLMGSGGARRVVVGLGDGVLTALAMLGEYARLLLLPFGLSAVHDFRIATSILDPRVLGGAAVAAAMGALAFLLRRSPGGALGLALLFLPLLPALYVPVLGEGLVAERYLYLPSAGLALLVALAWGAWPWRGRAGAWTRAAIAALLVAAGAAATLDRNRAWHDDLALWTDAVGKVPDSVAAREYLGFAQLAAGQPGAAVSTLSRAIELEPARHDARTNLASALAAVGRSEEAIGHLERVLAARPRSAEAHGILGYALAEQGRLAGAAAAYRRALDLDPSLADAHNALGVVLARLGDRASAAAEFREAMRLDPQNPAYSSNLGLLELQPAPAAAPPSGGSAGER